jgi:hypothetical protein
VNVVFSIATEVTAMLKLSIVLILAFGLLQLNPARATCTCIFKGGTVKEGETACIWTAKGNALARCEKVLNNTSWKLLGQSCPGEQSLRELPHSKAQKG